MGELTDWNRLTQNHRHALRILAEAAFPVEPREPRGFKVACHDLWHFKLAERRFREGAMFYEPTFLGRRVHQMLTGPAVSEKEADHG